MPHGVAFFEGGGRGRGGGGSGAAGGLLSAAVHGPDKAAAIAGAAALGALSGGGGAVIAAVARVPAGDAAAPAVAVPAVGPPGAFQQLLGDLLHKAGGAVVAGAAKQHPLLGAGEIELLFGPGHGHIAQAALLLHLVRLADGPDAGEDALLGPHQKDHGELQPLGRVHGHHHHAVLLVLAVQIGVQGDLVQKSRQGGLVPRPVQIAPDGGEKLPDVLQPSPVLHGVLGLQHDGIAGADHQLLVELVQGELPGQGGQLPHEIGEGGQLARRALQLRVQAGVVDDGVEGGLLPPGDGLGGLDGLGSDAPGRVVDDAGQAQVILRVVQHRQIGHHVLHLRPVKKPGAADDAIGDAVFLAGVLHLVGLGVHAIENGVVLPPAALAVVLQNAGGHILGLVVLVHGGVQGQLVPVPGLGPQLLALAALVVADDGVGRLQNVPGGAIVLLQADDPAALILLLEGQNILNGGPTEAIDRLVIVTHHAEVFVAPRQKRGQEILQVVGVLILVDEYIAELFLIIFPHVLKLLEQADGVEDDVVEI